MNHKIQEVPETDYYRSLCGALRRDFINVTRHVHRAYQRILKQDVSNPRIKKIAWELEQALVDLDRADLVVTAWGQPLPEKDVQSC